MAGFFSRFGFGKSKPTNLDAGKNTRRLKGLTISKDSINVQLRRYGGNTVARSRYLATNNADAASAKDVFCAALVGCGIVPSSKVKDKALKTAIMLAWSEWCDEADADGLTDFYGLQSIVAAEMFEAGECFVRFRPRLASDGLFVPFQLQLLPSEMLDLQYNLQVAPNGNKIQCGIEFDKIGRRVAYHFWLEHPGEDLVLRSGERTRVPAAEVLHCFRPMRAGQIRGLPHTLAGIVPTAVMDAFEDAMLERARTSALTVGSIKRELKDDEEHPLEGEGADTTSVEGAIGLEPAALLDLAPGEEFELHQAPDAGNTYEPFILRQKLKSAAGYGVPYADMTGDLRQATFGSQRAGMIQFRRRIEPIQHFVMIPQLCRPVWFRFFREAVLAEQIPLSPSDYLANEREHRKVMWMPPRWEWIDPEKDLRAERLAVRAGFKARSAVIESMGYDAEEVDEQIAADQERADKLGLVLDSDPRQTSEAGLTQARPGGTMLPNTDPNAEQPEPGNPADGDEEQDAEGDAADGDEEQDDEETAEGGSQEEEL